MTVATDRLAMAEPDKGRARRDAPSAATGRTRPRNFLIIYTAREGSTAIVAKLSRNPAIQVPLVEELDRHWISRFYESDLDLASTMDEVYASGTFDLPHTYGRDKYVHYDPGKASGDVAIGFKWRPHTLSRDLIAVLKRHDVCVLRLVRRDFEELVCSLYLSLQEIDGKRIGHAQFRAAKSEADFEETRETLANLTPRARLGPIGKIVLKRLLHASRHSLFLLRLRANGIETAAVYYEDFLDQPDRFFSDLCDRIGVAPVFNEAPESTPQLEKVVRTPAKARVRAHDRFPIAPVIGVGKRLYALILRIPA